MRKIALVQATQRLEKARRAVAQMKAAKSYAAFEEAWSEFLIGGGGVYAKLETGAKANGTSNAWFGRKKHDRGEDALLRYLHHARNTEEHGLEGSTVEAAQMQLGGQGFIEKLVWRNGQLEEFRASPGIEVRIDRRAMLVTVHDKRFGDSFEPPQTHLDQPLTDASPQNVATLALAYLEGLVAEAAKLPECP